MFSHKFSAVDVIDQATRRPYKLWSCPDYNDGRCVTSALLVMLFGIPDEGFTYEEVIHHGRTYIYNGEYIPAD